LAGGDGDLFRLRHQVADAFEEAAVGLHVGDGAGVGLVPGVEFGLQAVALGQQGDVFRGQVGHDGVKAFPERAAATPVPGSTSSSMKRYSPVATCRRWLVVRAALAMLVLMVLSLFSENQRSKK
jgi:hypothetical protein